MTSKLSAGLLATLILALLVGPALATGPTASKPPSQQDLAKVRKATERFKDVNVALKAGYVATKDCVEEPGKGGMGFHYLNGALIGDRKIDVRKPEILLYAPAPGGKLKLVGVEYFILDSDQSMDTRDELPKPLGRAFDGPMVHGTPVHYDLHVWLYAKNPKGTFAQYNPRVSC